MDQLSVYMAIGPLVAGRNVVVMFPRNCMGPNLLLELGAKHVTVFGSDDDLLSASPHVCDLSVGTSDILVDGVICVETYIGCKRIDRSRIFREVKRILAPQGFFVMSLPGEPTNLDDSSASSSPFEPFWKIEEELKDTFVDLQIFAQMPWQGFGFAPIDDEQDIGKHANRCDSFKNHVEVLEGMFIREPDTSQYLAIARCSTKNIDRVTRTSLVTLMEEDWQVQANRTSQAETLLLEVEIKRLISESAYWKSRAQTSEDGLGSASDELVKLRAQLVEGQLNSKQDCDDAQILVEGFEEENRILKDELAAQANEILRLDQRLQESGEERQSAIVRAEEYANEIEKFKKALTSRESEIHRRDEQLLEVTEEKQQAIDHATRSALEINDLRNLIADQEIEIHRLGCGLSESVEEKRLAIEKAEEYANNLSVLKETIFSLQSELSELSLQLIDSAEKTVASVNESKKSAEEIDGLTKAISNRDTEIHRLEQRATESAEENDVASRKIKDCEAQLNRLQEENFEHGAEIIRANQSLEKLLEEKSMAEDRAMRKAEEIGKLREEVADRDKKILQFDHQLQELAREINFECEQNEAYAIEVAKLKNALTDCESKMLEDGQRMQVLVGEKESALQKVEKSENKLEDLVQSKTILGVDFDKLKLEYRVQQKHLDHIQTQFGLINDRSSKLEERLTEKMEQAARLLGERDISRQRLAQLDQQLETYRVREFDLELRAAQGQQQNKAVEELLISRERLCEEISEKERNFAERNKELQNQIDEQAKKIIKMQNDRKELFASSENDRIVRVELEQQVNELSEKITQQTRQFVEEQHTYEILESASASANEARMGRLQLELNVRFTEQEFMLAQLEEAEQRIWEMTDESARNAARLQASLCVLEQYREQLNELRGANAQVQKHAELEVHSPVKLSEIRSSQSPEQNNLVDSHGSKNIGTRIDQVTKKRTLESARIESDPSDARSQVGQNQEPEKQPFPSISSKTEGANLVKSLEPQKTIEMLELLAGNRSGSESKSANESVSSDAKRTKGAEAVSEAIPEPTPASRLRVALIDVETWEQERTAREGNSG